MARNYTAEDFEKARAANPGLYFSDTDLKLAQKNPDAGMSILSAKNQYAKAQTPEERSAANAAAELIRRREGGYTGGKEGSGFQLDYTYAPKAEAYESAYTDLMKAATDKILNREDFSYNPAADASYQAYQEKYRNAGRNAMQNTLGSAAALTGGQLNSYALTAAQQANDAYNSQMSDMIPALQQAAYDQYNNERNQSRNDLSMLQGLDNTAYGRYADRRADELSVYDRNYGADWDIMGDQRYENEWERTQALDEYTKQQDNYNKEQAAYNRDTAEKERAFAQASEMAQMFGDFSGFRALGYNEAQIAQMQRDREKQLYR